MKITFQIAQVQYRAAINSFVSELNADATKLLKEEMRLLLRDIVRFTPPKTREQGERAVYGDLFRNAARLDADKVDDEDHRKAVITKDVAALRKIAENANKGFWQRTLLTTVEQLRASHLKNRTSYGRIRSDKRQMALPEIWDQYTKLVQGAVGFAKAGWNTAATAVGLNLPKWVKRHAGKAQGGYEPPMPDRLEITATNRSIKIPQYETKVVQAAVKLRAVSMKRELTRLLAGGKSRRGSLAATAYGQPAE